MLVVIILIIHMYIEITPLYKEYFEDYLDDGKVILKSWYKDDYTIENVEKFKKLLGNNILSRYKKIEIWNVFGPNPIQKEKDTLYIHFSGEPYYFKNSIFDIYLVPDLPDYKKNIINYTLASFAINSIDQETEHKKYMIESRLKMNKNKNRFCCFIVSNGLNEVRNNFFNELNKYKQVDSAGSYLNNMNGYKAPRDYNEFKNFVSQYKFMICFENTTDNYYLTEKLINAYKFETIPIYWGCPQASKIFNSNAFLQLSDKSSDIDVQNLINKIIELDKNDELYYNMFNQPLYYNNKIPDLVDTNYIQNKIEESLQTF